MHATSRTTLAAVGFLLVAAFFLTTEHRAHVLGLLPYLLLLACPLLHMFGHHGHGGHHAHGTDPGAVPRQRDAHAGHAARREDTP